MKSCLTYHGKERIKERSGVGKSKKKIQRLADNALKKGIPHSDFKGSMRRYLDNKYNEYGKGNNMKIHAGNVYVFQGIVLITMFPLPTRFKEYKRYIKKGAR